MNRHGLPVVDKDKCVACNNCVMACALKQEMIAQGRWATLFYE
jgi:Fe-S-cluster-containing dehydrogenase component